LHSNFKNALLANDTRTYTSADLAPVAGMLSANPLTASLVPLLRKDVTYNLNYNQYYIGSKVADSDLKLMSMDLAELGYRSVLSDKIQIDFEGFYSKAQNFDVLVDNGAKKTYSKEKYTLGDLLPAGVPLPASILSTPTLPKTVTMDDSLVYRNIPLIAHQFGITGTVNYTVSKKVQIKAFGTWQQTRQEKHVTIEMDTVNISNRNTPSFYGGLSVNYVATSKLEFYAGSYFYSSQTYNRYYRVTGVAATDAALKANAQAKVNGKIILNLRASYQFYKKNKVFVETKNLFFDNSREFGFADPIKTMVMGGVSLNF